MAKPPQAFNDQLVAFLPRMKVWALALTRNRAAAEDLTQDVAMKALAARDVFIPGTNFSAWIHRIMINHFISSVRNRREFTDLETMHEIPVPAAHEDRTALREFGWALNQLPPDQREALFMIVLQEKSYEAAAKVTGCAIGTLKTRVHRARLQLRAYLTGEFKEASSTATHRAPPQNPAAASPASPPPAARVQRQDLNNRNAKPAEIPPSLSASADRSLQPAPSIIIPAPRRWGSGHPKLLAECELFAQGRNTDLLNALILPPNNLTTQKALGRDLEGAYESKGHNPNAVQTGLSALLSLQTLAESRGTARILAEIMVEKAGLAPEQFGIGPASTVKEPTRTVRPLPFSDLGVSGAK